MPVAMTVAAVAGLGGAYLGADASKDAAKTQSQAALQSGQYQLEAARMAAQLQLGMFNTIRGDLAPYRDVGTAALPAYYKLLGLPMPSAGAAPATGGSYVPPPGSQLTIPGVNAAGGTDLSNFFAPPTAPMKAGDVNYAKLLQERPDVMAQFQKVIEQADKNSPWYTQHGLDKGATGFADWWLKNQANANLPVAGNFNYAKVLAERPDVAAQYEKVIAEADKNSPRYKELGLDRGKEGFAEWWLKTQANANIPEVGAVNLAKILQERPDVLAQYEKVAAGADKNSPRYKELGLDRGAEGFAEWWLKNQSQLPPPFKAGDLNLARVLAERPDVKAEYEKVLATADPNSPQFKALGLDRGAEGFAEWWVKNQSAKPPPVKAGDVDYGRVLSERPDVKAEYDRIMATADKNSPWFKEHGLDKGAEGFAQWWLANNNEQAAPPAPAPAPAAPTAQPGVNWDQVLTDRPDVAAEYERVLSTTQAGSPDFQALGLDRGPQGFAQWWYQNHGVNEGYALPALPGAEPGEPPAAPAAPPAAPAWAAPRWTQEEIDKTFPAYNAPSWTQEEIDKTFPRYNAPTFSAEEVAAKRYNAPVWSAEEAAAARYNAPTWTQAEIDKLYPQPGAGTGTTPTPGTPSTGVPNGPSLGGGAGTGTGDIQAYLETLPGYQFVKQQGLKAVTNSTAQKGLGGPSGAYGKGIARFVTGLADSTYASQVARLAGAVGGGQNAAAQTGSFGVQAASGAGSALTQGAGAYGAGITGAANASAAGQIGAANAWGGGLNGIADAYITSKILGMYGR